MAAEIVTNDHGPGMANGLSALSPVGNRTEDRKKKCVVFVIGIAEVIRLA